MENTIKTNIIGAQMNQQEVINAARKLVRGEFVSLVYMTEPSMRKTNNPFLNDCIKVTSIVCQAGISYGNSLENATGEKQEIEPMRGKHHIDWIIAQADKDENQYYICLQKVRGAKCVAKYFHKDGTMYTASEIEALQSFFYEKADSPKQQGMGLFGEMQKKPFQVKIENVISMQQGEFSYEYTPSVALAYAF